MRRASLLLWLWFGVPLAFVAAVPPFGVISPDTIKGVFYADRVVDAALSPDGQYLAYVVREAAETGVFVRDLHRPDIVRKVDRTSSSFEVPFLAWGDSKTLVYAFGGSASSVERICAATTEAKTPRVLLVATQVQSKRDPATTTTRDLTRKRPVRVLGFATKPAQALLIESAGVVYGDTTDLYRIDWNTGAHERIASEWRPGRILWDWRGRARVLETPRVREIPPVIHRPKPMSVALNPMRDGRSEGIAAAGIPSSEEVPEFEFQLFQPGLRRQEFEFRNPATGSGWYSLARAAPELAMLKFAHDDHDLFAPHSIPLAFDADPDVLYFASNVGRDTYGVYGVNLATGRRTPLAVENDGGDLIDPADPSANGVLVCERNHRLVGVRLPGVPGTTRWFDEKLARAQGLAEAWFPRREVRILQWDDARFRFLMLITGPADTGRFFVFEYGTSPQFIEVLRRSPMPAHRFQPVTPFSFTTAAGVRLTGSVTLPRESRVNPPALVVICRDVPESATPPFYLNRGAQALATLGFMVLDVNHRGTSGLGVRHRDSIREGFDRIPLEDIRAAMDWIATHHRFNPQRVALLGEGFGGFIALRGAQLYPAEFRCAIAIDAPADFTRWLHYERELHPQRDGTIEEVAILMPSPAIARRYAFFDPYRRQLDAMAPLAGAISQHAAVLIVEASLDRPRRAIVPPTTNGRALYDRLRALRRDAEYLPVESTFGRVEMQPRVYTRIAEFLNDHLYRYRVDVGETKALP